MLQQRYIAQQYGIWIYRGDIRQVYIVIWFANGGARFKQRFLFSTYKQKKARGRHLAADRGWPVTKTLELSPR